jgi:hypothetical protein
MLQRIQTLLLIIASGAGLAAYFFPIASFFSEFYYIKLGVFGVIEYTDNKLAYPDTILLPIILGMITLIAFVTIFLYKRRMLQVRLIRFDMLLNIVYLALVFFLYVPKLEQLTYASADYIGEPGIYLSIGFPFSCEPFYYAR